MLISDEWQQEGALVSVVIARQSPRSGKIAVACMLVDLGCLGVKTAFVRLCKDPADYQHRVLRGVSEDQSFSPTSFDLAARVIAEALGYARQLGFAPDPEYQQASLLLAGANPEAADVQVPLGKDGKPLFVAGPYDKVRETMARLERAVGPGGFHYLIPQEHPEAAHFPPGLPDTRPRGISPRLEDEEREDGVDNEEEADSDGEEDSGRRAYRW